ncbi:MAG: DNA mismatch repair endonuclease MutL, partial [Clostridia bacterium]|nr:DNA mismatch repair endonuclease MutL [Clostridia bacterium]
MGKIQVLSKNVSDKIAAGEVVERPASVIKEFLENSVDAGATIITVEIKSGGIKYMRVTDNGCGMSYDDTKSCILRHATSKISTENDLNSIKTLGFRGEALSSIAAVSKLEIYTKTRDAETGTYMIAENGEIIDITEAGCPDGTTVLVRELFCTVPARMKFLKKDYTEAGYIEDIVARLALSHPEISVKLVNNGKEVIFTPGDNQLSSAIYAVYGKDIKDAMIDADYRENGVRVFGMCAKSSAARANRNMQNFFVNGRYIKSALLSHAVEEAYKNELMVKKFPACVLNVEISPEMVDINIHPTKLEAKFADEKAVYHAVYWAAKNALYKKAYVPKVDDVKISEKTITRPTPAAIKERFKATPEVKVQTPKIDFSKVTPIVHTEPKKTEQAKISFGENTYRAPTPIVEEKPKAVVPEVVESVENKVVVV